MYNPRFQPNRFRGYRTFTNRPNFYPRQQLPIRYFVPNLNPRTMITYPNLPIQSSFNRRSNINRGNQVNLNNTRPRNGRRVRSRNQNRNNINKTLPSFTQFSQMSQSNVSVNKDGSYRVSVLVFDSSEGGSLLLVPGHPFFFN